MADQPSSWKKTSKQFSEHWEREVIVDLAESALKEQRRTRRWNVFFKCLFFLYLFGILWLYLPKDFKTSATSTTADHTALVELNGVIAPDSEASADRIITGLRKAFEDKSTKGVILRVNSPGGSPVQSGYINTEIGRLKDKYPEIPFYVVITDICASGGYFVAAAADKIYADKASLIGSIGVIMNGFGFVDSMEKLGVERRLITAGDHKGFLDPFTPVNPDEMTHVKAMLGDIHQQFINVVKTGRGDRLSENPDIFSGLIWTGEKSLELGLIDDFGSSSYVAREVIGAAEIIDFSAQEDYLERFAKRFGAKVGAMLLGQDNSVSQIR